MDGEAVAGKLSDTCEAEQKGQREALERSLTKDCLLYTSSITNHLAKPAELYKTKYQPPTGGTTEQEIRQMVPCSFYARCV